MSFLSKLFGSSKRDTTYHGARPAYSLSEVQGGKEYYQNILDRLANRGTGYGDDYETTANPIIANLDNQFKSYDLPELKSELTLTGRREGSGGFDQIRRAYQENTLAKNDILARLVQRNREAKRDDRNNAFTSLGDYANNEADLRDRAVSFDYADHNRQVSEADTRRQREAFGNRNLLAAASDTLLGFAGPNTVSRYSASGPARFNRLDPRNYLGYGISGQSHAERINRRNRYAALKGSY